MHNPTGWTVQVVKTWAPQHREDIYVPFSEAGHYGYAVTNANDAVIMVAGNIECCSEVWTDADTDEYNRRWDAGEVDGGVSMSVIEHYADGTTRTLANGEW